MHVTTKARLAVAAVAASAVSMGVAAPSFAAEAAASASTPAAAPLGFGLISAGLQISQESSSSDPLATVFMITAHDTDSSASLKYTLDFGDSTIPVTKAVPPSGTATIQYTYKAAGTYPVTLSVTDGTDKATATQSYTVGRPTLTAQTTVTTTPGSLAVSADLSKCAPAHGQIMARVTLNWGDGSSVVIENPTPKDLAAPFPHTYPAAGSYSVETKVVDQDGATATSTEQVTVGTPTSGGGGGGGTAVSRIAGSDRYQTAIAISSKLAAGSAPAVVLATGEAFPDALAGVSLAKQVGGPLLLTSGAAPDAAVTAEIKRVLKPGGTVYVLGGTNAVSPSVVTALGAVHVTRIGGADRYQTALKIADQLGDPGNVVLATGADYADALAAGPFASDVFATDASHPAAILLTDDMQMPAAVKTYLAKAHAVAAVGGQAVTAAKDAHITLAPHASFSGYDRYFTAAMVAATFKGEHTAGVATGQNYADALTGAAYLAQAGGPLLLTPTHLLAPATWAALQGIEASVGAAGTVEVFGGPVAVSRTTVEEIVDALHGHMA